LKGDALVLEKEDCTAEYVYSKDLEEAMKAARKKD